jgi:hypothetical protein
LRAARVIHCEEALHYHLLLLLAAAGVIRPEGKRIRRAVFRDQAARRIAPLLRRSDPAFQLDYITGEQVRRAAEVAGAERIRRHPWRIDMEWFRPGPGGVGGRAVGPLLLAGNMHRDESLVAGLLEEGMRVTRLGRHSGLRRRHEGSVSREGFELVVNAPHEEYLERLRGASALVLPILACDEPAGLTAAMEAVACGVPVLANESMGIAELFAECEYPLPLVGDLSARAWWEAWRELSARRVESGFLEGLERAREKMMEGHRILPGAGDWEEILAES